VTGLTSLSCRTTGTSIRSWDKRGEPAGPSRLEAEMVSVVDHLAGGPLPADMLVDKVGVESADVDRLIQLGRDTQLIQAVSGVDGTIL
jgi:hypothetical protein